MRISAIQAVDNSIETELKAIQKIQQNLNYDALSEAVNAIANSEKSVIVSGMGTSGILGRKIAASLSSIGCPSIFVHPGDALHGNLGLVSDESILIMVSHSGGTSELIQLLNVSKNLNLFPVLITSNSESVLAKKSRVVLNTGVNKEADPLGLVPTASAIATLVIGDALVSALVDYLDSTPEKFYRNHPSGSLGKSLSLKFVDVMTPVEKLNSCVNTTSTLLDGILAISAGRMGTCFVQENRQLMAILTDGDVRRIVAAGRTIDFGENIVSFSTQNYISVGENDLVLPTIRKMESEEKKVNVFPVLDDNRTFIGAVHIHDILSLEL